MFYEDLYIAKDVYQNIKEGVSRVEENSSGEMKKREKKKQNKKETVQSNDDGCCVLESRSN